jgi:predicted GIY-YIG superfamily endonuclease
MRREYAIKQLSREDKLRLIEKGTPFQWQETKEGNTVTQGETNDRDD